MVDSDLDNSSWLVCCQKWCIGMKLYYVQLTLLRFKSILFSLPFESSGELGQEYMDVDSDSISDPFDNDGTPISKLDPHFRLTQLKVRSMSFLYAFPFQNRLYSFVTGSREATS